MQFKSSFFSKLFYAPRKLRYYYFIQWNRLKFTLSGIHYGKNMRVFNRFYLQIMPGAKITIGNDFTFSSGEAFNPLCRNIRGMIYANEGATINLGNHVGISSACIWANEQIVIGNWVNIGGDCIIMDTDAHNLDWRIRCSGKKDKQGRSLDTHTAKSAPVIIEDGVFIGTRCIIMKGVTIGARTVVGSGSVVTKSIPADCIAAGNPCKVIKYMK